MKKPETRLLDRSLLSLAVVLTLAAAGKTPALDETTVAILIRNKGARAALSQIYEHKKDWKTLRDGIATGEPGWLKIANHLRPASDAGTAEQLELAVGEALEHQPENVLRLSVPVFSLLVCGGPDVDDARYDSYRLSIAAIEKRKNKVRQVSAPDLRKWRSLCIWELEESKAGIAHFYQKK